MKRSIKKILVVEDEKPLTEALRSKLEHEGFEVYVAKNGEEGITMLNDDEFDLVLLDLLMPKIDGFGVLEEIKKKHLKVPVFIQTNFDEPSDEERAKDLGAQAFFLKSDTPIAELVEEIKKFGE